MGDAFLCAVKSCMEIIISNINITLSTDECELFWVGILFKKNTIWIYKCECLEHRKNIQFLEAIKKKAKFPGQHSEHSKHSPRNISFSWEYLIQNKLHNWKIFLNFSILKMSEIFNISLRPSSKNKKSLRYEFFFCKAVWISRTYSLEYYFINSRKKC